MQQLHVPRATSKNRVGVGQQSCGGDYFGMQLSCFLREWMLVQSLLKEAVAERDALVLSIHLPRPFPKRRETGGNGEHADLWLKMGESRSSAEARARTTGRETGCRRNAEDGAGRSQQGRPSLRHRRLPTSPKPRWPVGVCSLVRCKSSACCGVDSCVRKQTSLACQALRKVALLDSDELRFGAQTLFLRNLPPLEQEVRLLTFAQDIEDLKAKSK